MGFSSHSRIFHSFREITITGDFFIYTRHTWPLSSEDFLTCIFNLPHLLWQGPTLYNGHLQAPVTLTPWSRVFGSGALSTCLNDLGLSWPGIELRFPVCAANTTKLFYRVEVALYMINNFSAEYPKMLPKMYRTKNYFTLLWIIYITTLSMTRYMKCF